MALRRVKEEKTRRLLQSEKRSTRDRDLIPAALIFLLFGMLAAFVEQYFSLYRYSMAHELTRIFSYAAILALSSDILAHIFSVFIPEDARNKPKLFLFGFLIFLMLFVARFLMLLIDSQKDSSNLGVHLLPVVLFATVFSLAFPVNFAAAGMFIGVSLVTAPFPIFYREPFISAFLPLLLSGTVAVLLSRRLDKRTSLLRVGLVSGFVHTISLVLLQILYQENVSSIITTSLFWRVPLFAFFNAVACAIVLSALMPYIERIFGVTTAMRLKDLADLNQPIMRRFLLEAPGTYHHSQIVGSLAEAAANAIGVDAVLCRVGGYFHDIGKINKPEYFTENEQMKGEKHSRLSPAMSALVIISHVKDGVEIARDLRLPKSIVEIIEQHHGTGLIEYFYREAVADAKREGKNIRPDSFRYPGPKPRTKEAAVIMLVDAIEAASRSLQDPSSARVAELVHEIVMKKLLDGQMDESPLTLNDVRLIEQSVTRVLQGMFHTRVVYPK
ncbi:MAG: HDIG domain-containing protein [Planctomycetota bacterium]|nr:HDIG domain-containing protein [Planctomycetota bacterium]